MRFSCGWRAIGYDDYDEYLVRWNDGHGRDWHGLGGAFEIARISLLEILACCGTRRVVFDNS